jgi:hypothetical protein
MTSLGRAALFGGAVRAELLRDSKDRAVGAAKCYQHPLMLPPEL